MRHCCHDDLQIGTGRARRGSGLFRVKAVRVFAVADASVLPSLRRALSPESLEIVATASTRTGVLVQLGRVCPDLVVVDLSLSHAEVFQLIEQLVHEHAQTVLALASGEQSAHLAERAYVAGASDVVERHGVGVGWHQGSGSPHVLTLRVLSLAASARPRRKLRAYAAPLRAAASQAGYARSTPATPVPAAAPHTRVSGFASAVRSQPPSAAGRLARESPISPCSRAFERDAVSSSRPAGIATSSTGRGSSAPASDIRGAPVSWRARSARPEGPLSAAQAELIAIGASTGGTLALAELLKAMPACAPPMLVVQHMLPEFTSAFAERLNELCALQVRIATDGETIERGSVLLAPGGRHLRVMRDAQRRLRARVTDELPVSKHRPSVDVLFSACAQTLRHAVLGVLLTGMGDDGARGLLAIHHAGGRTLVQDQASCVCFGMPSAAIALGAAQHVLPLCEIGRALRELARAQSSARA